MTMWPTVMQKLMHLPRDSRDTLFLLVVIALVEMPLMPHVPVWCSLMVAAIMLWRAVLVWNAKPLPARAWLLWVLVLTVSATWFTHRTLLGRDAGVTLIAILLALKTLEQGSKRDAYVVFFLSFFCMLSNFFFSQSLLTALLMLLALLGLTTILVNANLPVGKPPLLVSAKIASRLMLMGAPIMLLLFMLFPRLAPLWGLPSDAASGRTGLSAQMRVGTIAKLAQDDSIALRIKFADKPPTGSEIYLRGPVLSQFDGREWLPNIALSNISLPADQSEQANLQVMGDPIRYEVTLEPQNNPWVFVLDATSKAPQLPNYGLSLNADMQWTANRSITELVRYQAQSHLQFTHGPAQWDGTLDKYLALPADSNPRTKQMATAMMQNAILANANVSTSTAPLTSSVTPTLTASLVNAAMQQLRTGGYAYTLEPGLFGTHTADEFWFDQKAGFCEHIASSFVILMRTMNVPARLVTGYQGGETNPIDGTWVVRQSDAHAWVEVWQVDATSQTGTWLRVDPTSAVSPQRIDLQQRLAPAANVFGGTVNEALQNVWGTLGFNPLKQLRTGWEALNHAWNQKVLNYTQTKQFELLKNLGFQHPSWEDLGYLISALLLAMAIIGSAWVQWDKRQHDPWLRLLDKVQQRLKELGLSTMPHTTPRTLATQVHTHFGASANDLVDYLLQLERFRYAKPSHSTNQSLNHLRLAFRNIKWPAKLG
ncbi:MAG TPA: DUF3488 and transglutaminase-like domain-containing protein [Burkholderiaceae bacterium]|nr:DUF3488 and transglutaminase-like domain-containing protein [Burkholderiaceae bacterium]